MIDFNKTIKGCKEGDRKHQKEIYKQFYPTVYKTCMRYGSSIEEGEDLMQDTFIKVFLTISKFEGTEPHQLGGWIKTLAKNHCIDYKRKKIDKPIQSELFGVEDVVDEVDDYVDLKYSFNDVIIAVQKLSPRYNLVFNLFVMDGYSHDEISDILNISIGASKSNLYKAKANLRKYLEGEKDSKS